MYSRPMQVRRGLASVHTLKTTPSPDPWSPWARITTSIPFCPGDLLEQAEARVALRNAPWGRGGCLGNTWAR